MELYLKENLVIGLKIPALAKANNGIIPKAT